ncbi:molybdenum ABC transporter ATP-binding protein [Meridianimarinicoccus roseus]|uniref:Molybdenum ABC transporter ATP-binding protein n=1 Tax=Meridianimarinicoccus roseus TaxID=2072018 RepID=A0A2V2LBC4_9RHOB|nr:molybdenum ABC transporter ATP-binding protein [Meridianimarinicoccus roseus]PWR02502.1 molybdenum ABC transporter ATP-binding protein [Meridianimarinicoccus roseus]
MNDGVEIALRHTHGDFRLAVDMTAPRGVTALFGRSGAGKTTVVHAVAGLLRPDAGRIAVNGEVLTDTARRVFVPPHRRRLGYVFQEGRLFPHLSVRGNLLYARRVTGKGAAGGEFDRVVGMLGLGGLLARRPATLSGGEKQRVAIGRALLSAPRLLLMDEPLAALDDARKAEILPYLERLRDAADIPVIYVSHSVAEVARLATSVAVLSDGRLVRCGPVADVLSDPSAVRALGVREAGAILTGRVAEHHDDGLTSITVSAGQVILPRVDAPIGSAIRVRIAAQDVMLAREVPNQISALNILPVEVLALRGGGGPGVVVQLGSGTDRLLARITRRSADALALAPGMHCHALIKSMSVARWDVGQQAR